MEAMSTGSTPPGNSDDLAALRQAWQSMPEADKAKSLTAVYDRRSALFLSDNARIWNTAATMIPLSLGAFVALASISHPALMQIIMLSVSAWVLMTVWLIIAENHRAFQDKSQQVLTEIEEIWDFPSRATKSHGLLVGRGRVRQMRFALWWAVTIGALLVILFWPGGLVS
jgi:hypothetical protein